MARFNDVEVNKPQEVAPMGFMNGNIGMLSADVMGKMTQVLGEMWLAKQCPRSIADVQRTIDNVCASPTLATKGFYTYAKGGANVSGPSIRLAEALAAAYGNMSYGFEIISTTENKETKVRAYAFDKESNTSAERLFTVSHFIHTKTGDKQITDPREVYELVANYASRRIRACILQIIPVNLVDYAVEACENTLKAKVNLTKERIAQMLEKLADYGVTKAQVEAFIQRSVESIQPAQFVRLIGIYESLQDKIAKPEDFFPPIPQQAEVDIPTKVSSKNSGLSGQNAEASASDDGLNGPESFEDAGLPSDNEGGDLF